MQQGFGRNRKGQAFLPEGASCTCGIYILPPVPAGLTWSGGGAGIATVTLHQAMGTAWKTQ